MGRTITGSAHGGSIDVSVVIPVYNEEGNLRSLIEEIERALAPTSKTFEIIAIDDGSRDGSRQVLIELARQRPDLKVIVFRRNCGQSAAFDAGFRFASGRVIVTLDADRQNDPADIPKMLAMLDEGYDVVTGFRAQRQDQFLLRTLPSRIANFIIRRVTKTQVRDLGCSLKVYRREITDELNLYGEMHRFIAVLVENMGARLAEVPVNHRSRTSGQSKYGLTRVFKVLLDLVTVWFMRSYHTKPIYVFGGVGLLLLGISGAISLYVLYEKFWLAIWVHRNPLFILSMILMVVGVQFLGLGLLAEIVVRTYFESQQKKSYNIASKIGFE